MRLGKVVLTSPSSPTSVYAPAKGGLIASRAAADTLFSDFSVRRTVGRRPLVQPKFSTDELGHLLFSKEVVSASLPRYTSPSALSPGKRIHAAFPVHVAEKRPAASIASKAKVNASTADGRLVLAKV